MKNEILKRLKEIEKLEHIKILYAVESDSRGWGFESKNSDYNVSDFNQILSTFKFL